MKRWRYKETRKPLRRAKMRMSHVKQCTSVFQTRVNEHAVNGGLTLFQTRCNEQAAAPISPAGNRKEKLSQLKITRVKVDQPIK